MLYNLRREGFKGRQLYHLYCCYLRSVVEYCLAVYQALHNKGQEAALEKLHRHAIRICYCFDVWVEEVMEANCFETLRDRRVRRCDTFIRKAAANPAIGPVGFRQGTAISVNFGGGDKYRRQGRAPSRGIVCCSHS